MPGNQKPCDWPVSCDIIAGGEQNTKTDASPVSRELTPVVKFRLMLPPPKAIDTRQLHKNRPSVSWDLGAQGHLENHQKGG